MLVWTGSPSYASSAFRPSGETSLRATRWCLRQSWRPYARASCKSPRHGANGRRTRSIRCRGFRRRAGWQGVTLIGRLFDEGTLCGAGLALEKIFGVTSRGQRGSESAARAPGLALEGKPLLGAYAQQWPIRSVTVNPAGSTNGILSHTRDASQESATLSRIPACHSGLEWEHRRRVVLRRRGRACSGRSRSATGRRSGSC